jgi:hypothetical protein
VHGLRFVSRGLPPRDPCSISAPAIAQSVHGSHRGTQRVRDRRNVCTQADRRPTCKKETVADGRVTELIDEHYSIVTFPSGTTFEEGNTVERANR